MHIINIMLYLSSSFLTVYSDLVLHGITCFCSTSTINVYL